MDKNIKTIVVTGGSKGIGRAIIEQFASQGYQIITCARNQAGLEVLKEALESKYPGVLFWSMPLDVSKQESVAAFASFVKEKTESIAVLVNNAGVFIPGQICSEAPGTLEKMIETNLYSAYHLTRALAPIFIAQKQGSIFNMCSIASLMAYDNGGSYAISKFAMLGMSKALREEMKPHGVKVCSVMPGATKTASWDGVDIPEERFMKAADVADVIWMAANLSSSAVMEDIVLRPQLGDI